MVSPSTVILGTGAYVPTRVLTNDELSTRLDTTDEWIRTRTGIVERHIASPEEATSDLALNAARVALADAKLSPADIDLLIVATITPDQQIPATACIVQHKLGLATTTTCLDINAACSGFIYAMELASAMISTGRYR
ncbi:MAG TPA: 3-oxoacyl-ACP synthase, partial [Opitutaceae bacterium]|nr:3-oxoacyl-ACP synthase [Opitutaceae bacterium]